ncbi:MAG: hypothetical protein HZC03_00805 [Candidatus Lloydbacteria bacterium]|nr:hypothetical protein [Candidatus Lloydbacteria bacterium]
MHREESGHCKTSTKEVFMPRKNQKPDDADQDEDSEEEFVEMSDGKFKDSLLKRRIVLLTGDITEKKIGDIRIVDWRHY